MAWHILKLASHSVDKLWQRHPHTDKATKYIKEGTSKNALKIKFDNSVCFLLACLFGVCSFIREFVCFILLPVTGLLLTTKIIDYSFIGMYFAIVLHT